MSAPNAPLSDLAVNSATPMFEPPSSSEPSPNVQPMHQGNTVSSLEMQRQLLQQKLAEQGSNAFTSPTDQMMTPCSKKLQNIKHKAYGKGQPKLLSKAFAKPTGAGSSGGLFGLSGKENKSSSSLGGNPFGSTDIESQ